MREKRELLPLPLTKVCTKCGEEKLRAMFYPRSTKNPEDRRVQVYCIPCSQERNKKYKQTNWDKVYAKSREWGVENNERRKELGRKHYQNADAEIVARRRANAKNWRERNQEHKAEASRVWYERNKEITIKRAAEWAAQNRDKVNLIKTKNRLKRDARTKDQTPSWANISVINFLYATRAWISKETGESWHVDHIVPLMNRKVSGLHVHNNLRIIPARENLNKSNRLIEELL
jgi:hypothetical protein